MSLNTKKHTVLVLHGTNKHTMKTASMMILLYLLLAFTGLPVLASASDGEDPATSRLQRGEARSVRKLSTKGGKGIIPTARRSPPLCADDCVSACYFGCCVDDVCRRDERKQICSSECLQACAFPKTSKLCGIDFPVEQRAYMHHARYPVSTSSPALT
jgi:hypothetical protein